MIISKKQAIEKAVYTLKKYSRRSKKAKELEKHVYHVILANGCVNRLIALTDELEQKYIG